MKAGIDRGTSRIKAVWRKADGEYGYLASSDADEVAVALVANGVTHARVTGIGGWPSSDRIEITRCTDDPVADEIALQADGARKMFGRDLPPGGFLLVSVGTGTSYTMVPAEGRQVRFPLGNSIGGGFIEGLGLLQGLDVGEIGPLAEQGTPLDLLVKHLVPSKAGSFEGELVVSNFGGVANPGLIGYAHASEGGRIEDICATIVHCAAVAVIRDALILGMIPGFAADDVVFIGTPVAKLAPLRGHLGRYAASLGKRAHFPEKGAYAAALGALYAD
ncbi:MAG TPA: hypothetical protein VL426_03535 [Candidatus Binatia bacterium]|nr:hypothetical protein [Candidatus Binatia bacterium]